MKALVVYYSRTGNTKKVAEALAKELNADIEEIKDEKNRMGIIGWLMAGRDATLGEFTSISASKHDPSQYDLVLIGTPVWSWNLTPPVRTYLQKNIGNFKKIAFFATNGGGGADRTFKNMGAEIDMQPIATLVIPDRKVRSGDISDKIKDFVPGLR